MITLQEHRDSLIAREERLMYRWSEGTSTPSWPDALGMFANDNEIFAVYEISQGEYAKAKQHFYLNAVFQELAVRKFNSRVFDYNLQSVGNALLSDNDALIKNFAAARYIVGNNAPLSMEQMVAEGELPIWCHTIFMFILDNDTLIRRNLELIEEVTLPAMKQDAPLFQIDFDFLKALHNGDINSMENALNKLTAKSIHGKRNNDRLLKDIVSHPALTYAKLAWYKGYEVTVNSPLVPKELLPIQPLPVYEQHYDFLKLL